jgi:hypothetical protein
MQKYIGLLLLPVLASGCFGGASPENKISCAETSAGQIINDYTKGHRIFRDINGDGRLDIYKEGENTSNIFIISDPAKYGTEFYIGDRVIPEDSEEARNLQTMFDGIRKACKVE